MNDPLLQARSAPSARHASDPRPGCQRARVRVPLPGAIAPLLFVCACHVYVREWTPPPPARRPPPPVVYTPPAPPAPVAEAPPPRPHRVRVRASASREAPAPPAPPAPPVALGLQGSTGPDTTGCLDTGAAPTLDCGRMASPDPSCAPFPQARARCSGYEANFDPKVAAATVYCMTLLSSKDVCDLKQATTCAQTALAKACPDPSVARLCQIARDPCKTTVPECSAMLSGLNETGQEGVAQCVAHGCAGGLAACIDALPVSSSP